MLQRQSGGSFLLLAMPRCSSRKWCCYKPLLAPAARTSLFQWYWCDSSFSTPNKVLSAKSSDVRSGFGREKDQESCYSECGYSSLWPGRWSGDQPKGTVCLNALLFAACSIVHEINRGYGAEQARHNIVLEIWEQWVSVDPWLLVPELHTLLSSRNSTYSWLLHVIYYHGPFLGWVCWPINRLYSDVMSCGKYGKKILCRD